MNRIKYENMLDELYDLRHDCEEIVSRKGSDSKWNKWSGWERGVRDRYLALRKEILDIMEHKEK